jgi:pheromone shutdown protein TraB
VTNQKPRTHFQRCVPSGDRFSPNAFKALIDSRDSFAAKAISSNEVDVVEVEARD